MECLWPCRVSARWAWCSPGNTPYLRTLPPPLRCSHSGWTAATMPFALSISDWTLQNTQSSGTSCMCPSETLPMWWSTRVSVSASWRLLESMSDSTSHTTCPVDRSWNHVLVVCKSQPTLNWCSCVSPKVWTLTGSAKAAFAGPCGACPVWVVGLLVVRTSSGRKPGWAAEYPAPPVEHASASWTCVWSPAHPDDCPGPAFPWLHVCLLSYFRHQKWSQRFGHVHDLKGILTAGPVALFPPSMCASSHIPHIKSGVFMFHTSIQKNGAWCNPQCSTSCVGLDAIWLVYRVRIRIIFYWCQKC